MPGGRRPPPRGSCRHANVDLAEVGAGRHVVIGIEAEHLADAPARPAAVCLRCISWRPAVDLQAAMDLQPVMDLQPDMGLQPPMCLRPPMGLQPVMGLRPPMGLEPPMALEASMKLQAPMDLGPPVDFARRRASFTRRSAAAAAGPRSDSR